MLRHRTTRPSVTAVAVIFLSVPAISIAAPVDAFWVGGASNWNDPVNWLGGVVPNNGVDQFSVFIDDGNAAASSVTLDISAVVSNLTIDSNESLSLNNGLTLRVVAGVIDNAGTITIGSAGNNTYFRPDTGPVTLIGGGTLVFSDAPTNWMYRQGTGSLINVDNTIRGSGHFGWSGSATDIDNQGTIVADQTNPLILQTGTASMTNTGTLRAENGATLSFDLCTLDNSDGVIEALDGSRVSISGSTISGGTFQTSGSGRIESSGSGSTIVGTAQTVNNTGTMRIPNASSLFMAGTINNTGTIEVMSTGNNTIMRPTDVPLIFVGGGTIALSNSSTNQLYRQGTGSLVNVDNVIRGSGRLGWTGAATDIDNQGTIVADQAVPLSIEGGTSVTSLNTGLIRAENNATLGLNVITLQNAGGVVEALDGSRVVMTSAAIAGGTLQTTGTGTIETGNTANLLDGTLNAVQNTGTFRVANNTRVSLSGTINNTGTIELGSTGNNTYIQPVSEPVMLTGGGSLVMSDSGVNWIYRSGAGSLVNVDNTIRGAGRLGWTGASTAITNQGLVVADQTTALIVESGATAFTNTGTMRAESGATLNLNSCLLANTGGVVEPLEGSRVLLTTSTIEGGTLQTTGTGVIETGNSSNLLDGTANTLNNAGRFKVANSTRVFLAGTIHNTGTIELGSTGNNTYLQPQGNPTVLTGGGTLIMSDSSVNWIYRTGADGSLVNVDNTIRGAGHLGWNGASTGITNQGSVIAEGATQLLVDSGSLLFDNQGTMIVDGPGGMRIQGSFTTSGDVTVNDTRTLTRVGSYTQTAGSTIVNGALSANSGVDIQGGVLGGTGSVLNTVANSGSIRPGESAGILTINANLTQTSGGEIEIEIGGLTPGTEHDRLDATGVAAFDGTMRFEIINGFEPQIGDSFEVATFASRTGSLSYDSPCLSGGRILQVSESPTAIIVRVTDGLPADVNCDCGLDSSDIEAFVLSLLDIDAYLAAHPNCNGIDAVDLNADGAVNGLDMHLFVDAYLP